MVRGIGYIQEKGKGMIRILIIDDHAIVRRGLRDIVADTPDMEVVVEAANGHEGLRMVRKSEPDVILLDISMPGLSGLETLQQIKAERPNRPVLMLSMFPEEQYAVRALKLGASGYLTKESAPDELIAAIRKVAGGGRYVNTTLAEKLAEYVGGENGLPLHHTLSNRELQVMLMIAAGKSVKNIADELSLSVKTISTHRTRLLQKMQLHNNAEIVRYALDHGLSN